MATTELGLKIMLVEATATSSTSTDDKNNGDAEKRKMKENETSDDITDSVATEYTITPTTDGYTRVKEVTTKKTKITVDTTKKETTIQKHTITETTTTTFTKADGETISKYNTEKTTIGKIENVIPTLKRITFNREVYKPNEVVADIQLTASTAPSIADVKSLLGKEVKILRYTRTVDGTSTSESTDNEYTGFYIYDILPLQSKGKNLIIRAHIFSLDHQLTRKKYSRTYVAKKLFEDILLEGVDESKTTDYKLAAPNYSWKPSCLELLFPTYYKPVADVIDRTSARKAVIESKNYAPFDHLAYDVLTETDKKDIAKLDDNGKETTETEKADLRTAYERIQPYLVQYNESFYDFMVRTCNRCGEFFFFDNGALRLGRSAAGKDSAIPTDTCLSVFYTAIHTPDTDTSFDNVYYTLDDLNNLEEDPEFNYSPQGEPLNTIESNDGFYYNDEVNHDVYRTRIYKDKFDDLNAEMVGNENKYGVSFLSKVLNSTSIFDIIKGYGVYEMFRTAEAAAAANHANATGNKLFIDDDNRSNKSERETGANFVSSFTSANTAGHLDHTFYHNIRKEEEHLSRQLIVFNLSEPLDFAIGQEITYNSTTYVVIQIKDNPATNSTSKDNFSAIDPDAATPFAQMDVAVMQVVAIPLGSDSKVYPPLHPAGHIRRSEPQVAIVEEYKDPQQRGRVRIVYPWQQREDKEASPWIRVLTPSATAGGGCAFELNKGDEVLINYEAGNIERPYVEGTLFNRRNATPFRRGDMALISKNGHGITFNDPIDDRYFATSISPAYGWIKKLVGPSAHGTPDSLKLTGGITLSDAYGFYKIAMSTDQRKIEIASPFGDVNISAFTGITISAPNGNINIKGQNINIEAGNQLKITSGTNIRDKSYLGIMPDSKKIGSNVLEFGANFLEKIMEGAIDFIKPLVTVVDLNLLRTIIQVFLRPIDGTLEIHSYKYLLLEAGKGEATVEPNRYRSDKIRENQFYNNPTFSAADNVFRALQSYVAIIPKVSEIIEGILQEVYDKSDTLKSVSREFDTRYQALTAQLHEGESVKNAADITNAHKDNALESDYEEETLGIPEWIWSSSLSDNYITAANALANAVYNYYNAFNNMEQTCYAKAGEYLVNKADPSTLQYGTMKDKAKDAIKKILSFAKKQNISWEDLDKIAIDQLKKYGKIIWFVSIIKKDGLLKIGKSLNDNASNWAAFVANLSIPKDWQSTLKTKTIAYASSPLTQYIDFWNQTFRDWNHWAPTQDGQIIFSDQSGKSFRVDNEGNIKGHLNGFNVDEDGDASDLTALKDKLNTWRAPVVRIDELDEDADDNLDELL